LLSALNSDKYGHAAHHIMGLLEHDPVSCSQPRIVRLGQNSVGQVLCMGS
jgi:hypothetical protein